MCLFNRQRRNLFPFLFFLLNLVGFLSIVAGQTGERVLRLPIEQTQGSRHRPVLQSSVSGHVWLERTFQPFMQTDIVELRNEQVENNERAMSNVNATLGDLRCTLRYQRERRQIYSLIKSCSGPKEEKCYQNAASGRIMLSIQRPQYSPSQHALKGNIVFFRSV